MEHFMSTPRANQIYYPRFSIDLIKVIASLRDDAELAEYVHAHELLEWVCFRISELVGLSWIDVLNVSNRLAKKESLTGTPGPGGWLGPPMPDLSHVAARLLDADSNGLAAQVWREVREKCPRIAEASQGTPCAKPNWNAQSRELWLGATMIRTFSRRAHAQFAILDAFQNADWAEIISAPKGFSLKDAVDALNEKLTRVRFLREANDNSIRWQITV
jgi:hypothetical protein